MILIYDLVLKLTTNCLQPLPAMAPSVTPFHTTSSPRTTTGQFSNVIATRYTTIQAPSPLTPSSVPYYVPISHEVRNPPCAIAQGVEQHKGASLAGSANLGLIPTATLPQFTGLRKLSGDLDAMAEGWTVEERDAQRRLVQFTVSQTRGTVNAKFKSVAPKNRSPNSICISCILWSEKRECYVTSADIVSLMESLMGVQLPFKGKSAIRYSLEAFKPLTVSRAKADSNNFFKLIECFAAPRPLNIRRPTKVFPWKILRHALEEIIGKYVRPSFATLKNRMIANVSS